MKHTKTPHGLHRYRSALAATALWLAVAPAMAQQPWVPGTLDQTFGSVGKLTTDFFGAPDEINSVAAMWDGRFVAAGTVTGRNLQGSGSSPNLAVARYLPNGTLDPTFGTNGLAMFDRSGNVDEGFAVKVLPDRSVLVAGSQAPGAYQDFALVKLRPDGSLDTSFGAAGVGGRTGSVLLDVSGPSLHDEGRLLAVQSNGKIIVAGNTTVPVGNFRYRRATVARFSADGVLDTSFGGNNTGYVVLDGTFPADAQTSDYVASIATNQRGDLPANDSITLVGYTANRNNAYVYRLTRDGVLDTTFNGTGRVNIVSGTSSGVQTGASDLRAGRIDDAGRLVLVGTSNDRGFTFLRLSSNGSLDTTFGTNGRTLVKLSTVSQYDEPRALALQGNGKIVASGYATTTPSGTPQPDFFVVRLSANGQPDQGFGDGSGRMVVTVSANTEQSRSLAVEPSGKLLVAGLALNANGPHDDFAVLRAYGDPDRIFADDLEQHLF